MPAKLEHLENLIKEYKQSPKIFHAGRYWETYEKQILKEIKRADLEELRSGKYPIFGTFGFSESVYAYPISMPVHIKLLKRAIRSLFITNRALLPYSLKLKDIREMAYNNCLIQGRIAGIKSISEIEISRFGNPSDVFEIDGKPYTMQFLNFYIRLCFAQKTLNLKGDETIIELGSGSGFQVEVMKKVFPDLTILCFDLPYQLFLCEQYLERSLGDDSIVKSDQTIFDSSLRSIQNGKVNMFGNWQFPLLEKFKFDIFWNAASFGEMEPNIVENYLSYILNNCNFIFLLQAKKGKESTKKSGVVTPITFDDYSRMLKGFALAEESDAFEAHRKMSQSGGYFQAVWQK